MEGMAMSYPAASGSPTYVGTMIPEVWAGKLLKKYYEVSITAAISNTDYEGEIKNQGDTVHIRSTPTIIIKDHVKGQKLTYDTPEPVNTDLVIDKGKSWGFVSDDVTEAQADYAYTEDWTRDASEQMSTGDNGIDVDILANVYSSAHASNQGLTAGVNSGSINLGASGSPVALDKTNIIDYIVDMGTVLDEQNAPKQGRFLVLPPWACGLIKKSDLKDASMTGDDTSPVRNGRLGEIDRFTVYDSNILALTTDTVSVTNMLFGHPDGITFASQLLKNEGPMRSTDSFGDIYRGLQVYGYEVIKPEALGWFYAYKA